MAVFNLKEIEMPTPDKILKEALTLTSAEKAKLIDKLLSSLDHPDKEIDQLWAEEAESRIDAYEQGKLKALSIKEVLAKYK